MYNKKKVEAMKMGKTTERETNKYGFAVKKCCASCIHRYFDEEDRRRCMLTDKRVRGCMKCEFWVMSEGMQKVGYNRGKVQNRLYQLKMLEVREEENRICAEGMEVQPTSVESIRRDFEVEHGDRYLLH